MCRMLCVLCAADFTLREMRSQGAIKILKHGLGSPERDVRRIAEETMYSLLALD